MSDWRGQPTSSSTSHAAAALHKRSIVLEIIEIIVLAVVLFVSIRSVVLNYRVEGLSMAPTLANNELLLVNRISYLSFDAELVRRFIPSAPAVDGRTYVIRPPHRGDIVVLWPPSSTERPYIKRVIGLPGETVAITNGAVTINGVVLPELYINARPIYSMAPVKVKPGEYFVLGDNRNNSSDSHSFGTVPVDHIVGRTWLRYWPINAIGIFGDPDYPAKFLGAAPALRRAA